MDNLCLERFPSIAAIATHGEGAKILLPLSQSNNVTLWLPSGLNETENTQCYHDSLKAHLKQIWATNQAFVFCLATGAVVRLIAPLLQAKSKDPAIVVIDAQGRYVISLCSGHQGGANLLAQLVAHQLGATAILTGAAESLELPAIDTLGFPYGWQKGTGNWTGIMAAVARRETVEVIQEVGTSLWTQALPDEHSLDLEAATTAPQGRIWIGATKRKLPADGDFPQVQWHPRLLWLGIGCERGTSAELIQRAIAETCLVNHLAIEAIAGIATIDLKADEVGILEVCRQNNLPLKTFAAEALNEVQVPTPSDIVAQEVGTASVAEAGAILASGNNDLLVAKQIFKSTNPPGAVTVAIGQAEREYLGRTGKLYLVGIGPGDVEQITPAAKTAITEADVIIGYSLYTDLIKPLQRTGQVIESLPITQEQERAQRAIALAQWGLTVAVVSSGDCGIYGMAGLVLEALRSSGWDGQTPQVQVFPGISALQSAASRVGAPLMHDFCAISLSDLLTPWEVIAKRLSAAAEGDFITAIYNPRSLKRTEQIVIARDIFLQYRSPDTPVAIVRAAYRQDEQVILTTLDNMLDSPIDMLTTVIIGNSTTLNYAGWMITPRGYEVEKKG